MTKFITWDNKEWSIPSLANEYKIKTGTLYDRLRRFGNTASGISRSLTTGIMTKQTIGRVYATRSPWKGLNPWGK